MFNNYAPFNYNDKIVDSRVDKLKNNNNNIEHFINIRDVRIPHIPRFSTRDKQSSKSSVTLDADTNITYDGKPFIIRMKNTNKCINNTGGALHVWDCAHHPDQTWTREGRQFKHIERGKCMDCAGRNWGDEIWTYNCGYHSNRHFDIRGGKIHFNGLCLSGPDSLANGQKLRLWECKNWSRQNWELVYS